MKAPVLGGEGTEREQRVRDPRGRSSSGAPAWVRSVRRGLRGLPATGGLLPAGKGRGGRRPEGACREKASPRARGAVWRAARVRWSKRLGVTRT